MPKLADLKAAVDAGRTAKHLMRRSILHHLVRKEHGYYARQAEGYVNEIDIVVVPVVTSFYPTWELLTDSFQGRYDDDEWQLCDDQFADYLPPDHQEIP